MKRIVIIGAGLGGLATAIRLAHYGFDVTVLEKNSRVGGKLNIVRESGYTFDTGPSLLTMPFILDDLFQAVGRDRRDYLDVMPVDPICRYNFSDGSRIDAWKDLEKLAAEVARISQSDAGSIDRFFTHAERIYRAASGPFLFQPFGSLDLSGILRNLSNLPAVLKIDAFRSLNDAVSSFFVDERIRQLFNRFATYNGSSPYRAPATLAIIPFIEFHFGGWYIQGGMYRLAEVLRSLALELGVNIRTSTEVRSIEIKNRRASGVKLADGETIKADRVVSNADALYAREQLLDAQEPAPHVEPSLGGFVLLLGVKKRYAELSHHNIFFSPDYRSEFESMVDSRQPAQDPTIYVANTSFADPTHAPEGCSNLFVLVNAPPLEKKGSNGSTRYLVDWESRKHAYRDLIVRKLESYGINDIERNLEYQRIITPLDFERSYHAFRGSIYGTSSNGRMSAFLRPPNKSRSVQNLFFVGGSSHPGGGIPLVLLSGKIVSDLVLREA